MKKIFNETPSIVEKQDVFAKLKEAVAQGKKIQVWCGDHGWQTFGDTPAWVCPVDIYRVKPEPIILQAKILPVQRDHALCFDFLRPSIGRTCNVEGTFDPETKQLIAIRML